MSTDEIVIVVVLGYMFALIVLGIGYLLAPTAEIKFKDE